MSDSDQDRVIRFGVAKYSECSAGEYKITRWPDKEPTGRNSPEIDAYAESSTAPALAIEHTRLQSFKGQLLDDARITEFFDELEREVGPHVAGYIHCSIPVLSFRSGFNWLDAQHRIRNYLISEAMALPTGNSVHNVPCVPFPISIWHDPSMRPSLIMSRIAPAQDDIDADLAVSMKIALGHKKQRLMEYKKGGARTVLILDSRDVALIGHIAVYKAFLRAQLSLGTEHLDDVLFARTADHRSIELLCFYGDEKFLKQLNPPNFKLGPSHRAEWENAL